MMNNDDSLESKLSALVDQYNLEGLVAFSQQQPQGDAEAWHNEVMESGFMALYSYVSYDQMCGKLGEGGLDFLDEIIEATETFHGSPLRKLRTEVLHYRIDEIKDTDVEQATVFALRAVEELNHDVDINHSLLPFRANFYHELAELNKKNALHYWQLAVDDLASSSNWNLRILYHAWDQSIPGMKDAQQRAHTEFIQRINKELSVNPDLIWELLDDGIRIQEYKPDPELGKQIAIWLQTALVWKNADAKPSLLRTAGLLLHKQGIARQQEACFAKAIECFELFITKDRAHAMEVNYISNVFEDWAMLAEQQGGNGTDYLMKAWNAYRTHEEVVRINFSPLLHYAEFLLRLYFNDKLPERPTEEKILRLAIEAEVMGNGYYSGPGMIQTLTAINKNDAATAIHHLCRLLLRHELCIDRQIKNLRESLTEKAPQAVADFLDEALKFMDDVSNGYFYDPKLSMAQLNELSREETISAWQARMAEIRNRPFRN